MRHWRFDDARQTMVLCATAERLPEVVYWGARLPDDENLAALTAAHRIDITGGMLDAVPDLSICPEASQTFPGHPGLIARDNSGRALMPALRHVSDEKGDNALSLIYADSALGLTYRADFRIYPDTHMIEAQATLTSAEDIAVHWLSAPVLPAPQNSDEMIDVSGRWCGEFQLQRVGFEPGIRMRHAQTGRSGHEHFPGLYIPARGTSNCAGDAYAFHLGWSGGHSMIAEELPDGRRQIQFGKVMGSHVETGRDFTSAPLFATFSVQGLNGTGISFQRHANRHIVTLPKPKVPRPVHYNCWEAIYFDHDLAALKSIATRATDLGAERFVLDDGWFGKRDDDTTSLGDWRIDPRKYPDGLTPLIKHIHGLGMTFGIWFEPEMVNPDSDLYRAHPNWALGDPQQTLGRQQMVLNMALPDVREYLYGCIAAILKDHDIDYIKWDHNRLFPVLDAAQADGTYELLARLRADFPDTEIETCASGGGRIDFGILEHTQRVWLSDSNDALERLRIQHDAALFLPISVTGSHVGPRVCHTSGRVLDMTFRAWVAAQRHMGFEMDPRELTEDEADTLKRITHWWKDTRGWRMAADIHRLDSDDPSVLAEQQMCQTGERFVVFSGKHATSTQISPRPLRLAALQPDAQYRIELLNRDELSTLSRGKTAFTAGSVTLSGQYLMQRGIALPITPPAQMWVLTGERI